MKETEKKVKKPSRKEAKKRAWRAFARYIKARDADIYGNILCCSCRTLMRYNEQNCHAGHFVAGRANAILFDEQIVHGQCSVCNHNDGEQYLYSLFMKEKYGYNENDLRELQYRKNATVKYTFSDYVDIAEEYNNKADAIIKIKGI